MGLLTVYQRNIKCKNLSFLSRRGAKPAGAPESSHGARTPSYGGQTPMYGSRTPMYGSQTPLHDESRTPHYGGMTPSHETGGRTPLGGGSSVWDPSNANTPSRWVCDFCANTTPRWACHFCSVQSVVYNPLNEGWQIKEYFMQHIFIGGGEEKRVHRS